MGLQEWEGVALRRLRGRKMGPFLMLDMEIVVPPRMSASAAHHIAEHVRRAVMEMSESSESSDNGNGGSCDGIDGGRGGGESGESFNKSGGDAAESSGAVFSSIGEVNVHVEPRGAINYEPFDRRWTTHLESESEMGTKSIGAIDDSLVPPLPHLVEEEVRRVVMKLNTAADDDQDDEEVEDGGSEGNGGGSDEKDHRDYGDGGVGQLPARPLRGDRAIGGVSECQSYYIDGRLSVKIDVILSEKLAIWEAHAIARLVRKAVLEECNLEGLAEVDVDLELDEKGLGSLGLVGYRK